MSSLGDTRTVGGQQLPPRPVRPTPTLAELLRRGLRSAGLLVKFAGVVVLVLLLVLLKGMGVLGKEEGTRVSAEKVALRNITEVVTASGKVYPEKEVKISPDISGEVVDLGVTQEGDSVHKGQELAKIYADIYTTQRDQAAAQMNQQQAMVSNAQAMLPGLKTNMEVAKKALDREKQLLDQKVVSLSEYETAEGTLQTAQANYMAALQTVKGNSAGAVSARANLDIAAKNLSRTQAAMIAACLPNPKKFTVVPMSRWVAIRYPWILRQMPMLAGDEDVQKIVLENSPVEKTKFIK